MDPLRDLLDHPPRDSDAPRDPLLTARVMERVRVVPAAAPTRSWWLPAAVVAALLALTPLDLDPGAMLAALDPGLALELAVAVAVALGVLAGARRLA
jgi:hypothetical protein